MNPGKHDPRLRTPVHSRCTQLWYMLLTTARGLVHEPWYMCPVQETGYTSHGKRTPIQTGH